MVCGRLSVRLVKVRGHCDIVERRMEVKSEEDATSQTTLVVNALQLISWPKGGLPHSQSIITLLQMLTGALMKSSNKKSVVMCWFVRTILLCGNYMPSPSHSVMG